MPHRECHALDHVQTLGCCNAIVDAEATLQQCQASVCSKWKQPEQPEANAQHGFQIDDPLRNAHDGVGEALVDAAFLPVQRHQGIPNMSTHLSLPD